MFQFTTENLLNDLSRVSTVTPTQDKAVPTGDIGLKIKSLNTFAASKMSTVWKAVGSAPTKEQFTITLPTITDGTYRLTLSQRLSGSADADYSRWDAYYGKPIDVEMNLTASDTGTTVAAKLQAYFNKYNAQASTRGITVTASGQVLTFTQNTEFVRIQPDTVFAKYDAPTDTYVKFNTAGPTVTVAGNEGFGSAWWLLKNFRIPTQEATYFTAENLDERPIAGTIYNQYTFRYSVRRNINGMGAVGEEITSTTTHVFYVLSNLSTAFEAFLTTAGVDLVVANADPATAVDDLLNPTALDAPEDAGV